MKNVVLTCSKLKGEIIVPSSKSMCHRAVICAGLSKGICNITNVTFCNDINASCEAMKSFGANIKKNKNSLIIEGKENIKIKNITIDCNESGSTLRFLIPLAAIASRGITFEGRGKLVERPLNPYYKIFDEKGINYKSVDGKLPLTIDGKLKAGEYSLKGDVSSQFISGLLFALPILEGDSKISLTTELESKPYVDLTLDMLKNFSVNVINKDYREFVLKGNQKYRPRDYKVEGDFSQAAFWLVAGIFGANVTCHGLNMNSLQGDKAIIEIIKRMGGTFQIEGNSIRALACKTRGTVIDASQCPDLVPVLTVLGALSKGTTEIINASRLRIKESDRLRAIRLELNKIGGNVEEKKDGLVIRGREELKGGTVHSWNDHRIAMALTVASLKCSEPLIIEDALCVSKSYPNFWKDFKKIGGVMDEWNVGKEN